MGSTLTSLLCADDVVLLASDHDLQHTLGRFAAECEAASMSVSTSKAMVLCQKTVNLHRSIPHLWSLCLSSDRKNEIALTSIQKEFSLWPAQP